MCRLWYRTCLRHHQGFYLPMVIARTTFKPVLLLARWPRLRPPSRLCSKGRRRLQRHPLEDVVAGLFWAVCPPAPQTMVRRSTQIVIVRDCPIRVKPSSERVSHTPTSPALSLKRLLHRPQGVNPSLLPLQQRAICLPVRLRHSAITAHCCHGNGKGCHHHQLHHQRFCAQAVISVH